jgi:SAM-dependent methyltransferase
MYLNLIKEGFQNQETISDGRFDQIFDQRIRKVSSVHWTPVEVVLSILELLNLDEGSKVLDVGSGSGKFCLVGALNSKASFVGVEQRQSLVKMANQLAAAFDLDNASFIYGNAVQLDWSDFDVIYLFNPYYENIMDEGLRIDLDIKVSQGKYKSYITATINKLNELRVGTKIVTYYGFGQGLPDNFKLMTSIPRGASQIELWIKDTSQQSYP